MPAEGVSFGKLLTADAVPRYCPGPSGMRNEHSPIGAARGPAACRVGRRLVVDLADRLAETPEIHSSILDAAHLHQLVAGYLRGGEGNALGEDSAVAVLDDHGHLVGARRPGAGRPARWVRGHDRENQGEGQRRDDHHQSGRQEEGDGLRPTHRWRLPAVPLSGCRLHRLNLERGRDGFRGAARSRIRAAINRDGVPAGRVHRSPRRRTAGCRRRSRAGPT